MTNKSEKVSVPRELLERLCMRPRKESLAVNHKDILDRGRAQAEMREILAAPADDVRAVVDEPVVYQVKIHGMTLYWNTPSITTKAINTPLYRHPQRQVVMPERLREIWLFLDGQAELNGCVFGEKPEGLHNFWWRKELRAVLEELYPPQ